MSFYGKNYRPRPRSGVGFQAPGPAGPRGPGGRGGTVSAPSPGRSGKPTFTIPPFPRRARVLLGLSPYRKWMQAYRKAKLIYKFVEANKPELLPFSPPLPGGFVASAGGAFYDCPTVSQPYETATMYRLDTLGGSSIPSYMRCTGGQVPTGELSDGQELTAKMITVGPGSFLDPVTGRYRRMQFDLVWRWPSAMPAGKVKYTAPRKPTYTVPGDPYFTADPEDAPIFYPAPFPMPLPFRLIPLRPDRGVQPSGDVQGIITRPLPHMSGYADPGAGPAVQTDGGGLSPAPPHVFMPPGRGDKEKKHNGGPAAQALQGLMNRVGGPVTEGADAIKAVYDALGKKCKGANTPQAQLQCIYTNWSTLDAGQAVANLIANEAQDRAIGKIGSAVKSVGGKRPGGLKPIGWGTGPAI